MTSSHKFSLSLLISVIAFAVFSVLALSGRFGFIEAKFYQPAVRRPIEQRLNELGEQEKHYKSILIQRFSSFVTKDSIFSFTKAQATDEQVRARESECARLFSISPYLMGIRIIDSTGRRLHYSTFESDIKRRDPKKVIYEDYSAKVSDASEIPFEQIAPSDAQKYKIFNDSNRNRIVYSFPLFGKDNLDLNAERAVAVFYCDPSDFIRYLFSMNALSLSEKEAGEYLNLGNNFGGYIFGLPYRNFTLSKSGLDFLREEVKKKVLSLKTQNTIGKINQEKIFFTGEYFLLNRSNSSATEIEKNSEYSTESESAVEDDLTVKYDFTLFAKISEPLEDSSTFVAILYDSEIFEISTGVRILLLTLLFITLFLLIFLVFNLRHDDSVVIKERISSFQREFLKEYVSSKLNGEKKIENFSLRKKELNDEIIKSLGRRGKKHKKEVEDLLEKNWAQMNFALGNSLPFGSEKKAIVDSTELKNILEEILGSGKLKLAVTPQKIEEKLEKPESVKTTEELEEVEEVDAVEEVETVDEVEAVEEVDALEELDEVDAVEEVDDAEEVETVAEVEAAEEVDSVEEIESVDEIEASEEVDALEVLDEVDAVEDVDDAEEIESVAEVEASEEVDALEELDEVDAVEDVDDAEEVETADEIEAAEEVDAVETVDEIEEVDISEFDDEISTVEMEEVTDLFIDDDSKNEPIAVRAEEFTEEEVGFGSPVTQVIPSEEDEELVDNFNVSSIDFSFLDDEKYNPSEVTIEEFEGLAGDTVVDTSDTSAVEETDLDDKTAITEDVELIDVADVLEDPELPNLRGAFLFTTFGAGDRITDLSPEKPDVIIENADGTYRIEKNPESYKEKLDLNFKKLVESVLK